MSGHGHRTLVGAGGRDRLHRERGCHHNQRHCPHNRTGRKWQSSAHWSLVASSGVDAAPAGSVRFRIPPPCDSARASRSVLTKFGGHPAVHLLPDGDFCTCPPGARRSLRPSPLPVSASELSNGVVRRLGGGARVRVVDVHSDAVQRHVDLHHKRYVIAVGAHRVADAFGEGELRGVDSVGLDALRRQSCSGQLPYGAQVLRGGRDVCSKAVGPQTRVEAEGGWCGRRGEVGEGSDGTRNGGLLGVGWNGTGGMAPAVAPA